MGGSCDRILRGSWEDLGEGSWEDPGMTLGGFREVLGRIMGGEDPERIRGGLWAGPGSILGGWGDPGRIMGGS